jgi:hypothetical protein
MKHLKLRYIVLVLALILLAVPAGVFIQRVRESLKIMGEVMHNRTCRHFVEYASIELDEVLKGYSGHHDCFYPCKEYFGPLTPEMLSAMGAEEYRDPDRDRPIDDWAIDPFNRTDPATVRKGPRWWVDRGATVDIEGNDLKYCTDGKTWYLLISYGPDGDLDLTEDVVRRIFSESEEVAAALEKFREGQYAEVTGGDFFYLHGRSESSDSTND